jgi:pimeloyl-ACP methyl ester carboxylesterase
VADIVAVMDGLGWDTAYLMGHSWGGHLVFHAAVGIPGRLAGGRDVETQVPCVDGRRAGEPTAHSARDAIMSGSGRGVFEATPPMPPPSTWGLLDVMAATSAL